MMKLSRLFVRRALLALMLAAAAHAHADRHSEAEVYAYRQQMHQAGQQLAAGNAQAAFHSIRRAAEQGYAEAQYILATLYQDGEGTAADPVQAHYWYTQAAQNNNPAVRELAQQALSDPHQGNEP